MTRRPQRFLVGRCSQLIRKIFKLYVCRNRSKDPLRSRTKWVKDILGAFDFKNNQAAVFINTETIWFDATFSTSDKGVLIFWNR